MADWRVSIVLSQKPNLYILNEIMKTKHTSVTRRNELLSLISEGSTDEKIFIELKKLNETDANAKKAWSEAIQSIVETMAKSEPSIEIADLITANPALRPNIDFIYDVDAFIAGAKVYGLSVSKIPKQNVGLHSIYNVPKSKDLGKAILVLKVPKAKGQPTKIYQYSLLPADTSDMNKLKNSFLYVRGLEGDIGLNLRKFSSDQPEVQTFLSTVEGDEFINKWAGWISRGGKRR